MTGSRRSSRGPPGVADGSADLDPRYERGLRPVDATPRSTLKVVMRRTAALLTVLSALLTLSACGSQNASSPAAAASEPPAATCPSGWAAGWQRLANRIHSPVYCPRWVPSPLTPKLGEAVAGQGGTAVTVNKDGSYLVSLIWSDASGEVHVNFGGYLHRTSIPRCEDVETTNGETVRTKLPCFGDPSGTLRAGTITATLYTVNRGPDQWHLLYAWKHRGSLYTVSQHVAAPLTYPQVAGDLKRMLRELVLLDPAG
jgi:hypothetical protein